MVGSFRSLVVGSSPLARGLLDSHPSIPYSLGIIPARAGFTTWAGILRQAYRDHPRSRGVYFSIVSIFYQYLGSSPLARGLRAPVSESIRFCRIIPARAGFTQQIGGSAPSFRGSSPLARGLPHGDHLPLDHPGIIPARAGFTLADPWNPNEPVLYQTPAAFTADLGSAPPSCGSAVVVPRWTTTPSGA